MAAASNLNPTQKAPTDYWHDLATYPTIEKCLMGVQKLKELRESDKLSASYGVITFDVIEKELKVIQKSYEANPSVLDKDRLSNCRKILDKAATAAFIDKPTAPFTTHSRDLVVALVNLELSIPSRSRLINKLSADSFLCPEEKDLKL